MVLGTGWLRDESDSLGQTYYPIQIGAARENVWLQSQRIQLPPVGNMTGLTNVADGQIAFSDGKLYLRSAGSWVELATAT